MFFRQKKEKKRKKKKEREREWLMFLTIGHWMWYLELKKKEENPTNFWTFVPLELGKIFGMTTKAQTKLARSFE